MEPVTPPRAEDWHTFMYDLGFSGASPDQSLAPTVGIVVEIQDRWPPLRLPSNSERHFIHRLDRWQIVCTGCQAVGY